jgi:acyl carrier protein
MSTGNHAAIPATDSPPRVAANAWFAAPNWYVQQKDWIVDPTFSDSVVYNYPLALRIQGAIDKNALQASLEEIVHRHEPLRSVFRVEGNNILQLAGAKKPFLLPEIDLRGLEQAKRESTLQDMALKVARIPFDLRKDCLLRGTLFAVDANEYFLLLASHRAAFDDWSMGILLNELSLLYPAFAEAKPSPLAELSYSYSEFARDLRDRMGREELQEQLRYWEERLKDRIVFHHLKPTGLPDGRFHGKREASVCSAEVLRRIERLAQEERMTPFMIAAAAFQCLLSKHSNEDDIGIGCCAANRNSVDLEGLIGPFSNRFVLRTDFSDDPRLRDVLLRVRRAALEGYSFQDVPFGELLKRVKQHRPDQRKSPIQAVLTVQGEIEDSCQIPGLRVTYFPIDVEATCYDLFVMLKFNSQAGLSITFQYNSECFEAEQMRELLQGYVQMLALFAEAPNTRLSGVAVASAPTRVREARTPFVSVESKAPPDKVQKLLQKIWSEVLEVQPIDVDAGFFKLGGDSLQAARMFARVEASFGVRLALTTLLDRSTIRELAEVLRGEAPLSERSSLVPLRSSGTQPPIFCIHARDGDVLSFRNFPKYVSPERPLYGLQAQALNGGPPHFSIEEMARHYIHEIQRIQPKGPYYLFGYCFGGTVAFDMALQLHAEGQTVAFLGMFYTSPPGSLKGYPIANVSALQKIISRKWEEMRSQGVGRKLKSLLMRSFSFSQLALWSARIECWRLMIRCLGPRTAQRLGGGLVDIHSVHVAAAKDYHPQGVFSGRITFILPVAFPYEYSIAPEAGWAPFATEGVHVIEMQEEPGLSAQETFAKAVGQSLKTCMEVHPKQTINKFD